MKLAHFPRLRFIHGPTPLEPMPALSRTLGGPNLWIKRDDNTGLATGGNKTRKLEFLMAEAVEQEADIVLTHGATQSNHARQTAAAAAKLGMACEIVLEDRTGLADTDYRVSGNVLLDVIFGATLSHVLVGTDMDGALAKRADVLRTQGKRPYVIPGGGSNPVGALGYVVCAQEIALQANEVGLEVDCVVHATGSAGTQAGLVAGFEGSRARIPVLGIGVRAPKAAQEEKVFSLATRVADLLEIPGAVKRESVVANCDYVGAGYGLTTPGMIEAVQMVARTEGILLDPVYSGKGMAGLIDLIRRGHFNEEQDVVFVHTGGVVGLFAYRQAFMQESAS